jgi:hypothetical protein
MQTAFLVLATLVLLGASARAENWTQYDNLYFYDADSATYDPAADVVVVHTSADVGWMMMSEDEEWEYAWTAFRCNTNGTWTWSEKNQSWGKEYTLDRADEMDTPYVWTRDRLCGVKASLHYRAF